MLATMVTISLLVALHTTLAHTETVYPLSAFYASMPTDWSARVRSPDAPSARAVAHELGGAPAATAQPLDSTQLRAPGPGAQPLASATGSPGARAGTPMLDAHLLMVALHTTFAHTETVYPLAAFPA